MTETTSLDDLFTGSPLTRPRGCNVCGEPAAAGISVVIRRSASGNRARSASTTRSFCEQHALEMWERLTEGLANP